MLESEGQFTVSGAARICVHDGDGQAAAHARHMETIGIGFHRSPDVH